MLHIMKNLIVEAHSGQLYGDNVYTVHLYDVLRKVLQLPDTEPVGKGNFSKLCIVALGHDLIEDTSETVESLLERGFSAEIVHAIDLCTKKEEVPYNDYLRTISENDLAWKVKVADTYSNMTQSMKEGNVKRVNKYSQQLNKLYKLKGE